MKTFIANGNDRKKIEKFLQVKGLESTMNIYFKVDHNKEEIVFYYPNPSETSGLTTCVRVKIHYVEGESPSGV